MRLSSPSASTFSSQASRSLELAPRTIFLTAGFAGCRSSPAAPTVTPISMALSRVVLCTRPKSSVADLTFLPALRVIRGNANRAIRGTNVGIGCMGTEGTNKGPAQGPGQDGEETNNG